MTSVVELLFPKNEFLSFQYSESNFFSNYVLVYHLKQKDISSFGTIQNILQVSGETKFTVIKLLSNQKYNRIRNFLNSSRIEIIIGLDSTVDYVDNDKNMTILKHEVQKIQDTVTHYSVKNVTNRSIHILFVETSNQLDTAPGLYWKNFLSNNDKEPISDNFPYLPNLPEDFNNQQLLLYNLTSDNSINFDEFHQKTKFRNRQVVFFIYEPLFVSPIPIKYNKRNLLHYYDFPNKHKSELYSKELDDISLFAEKNDLKITVYTCDYNLQHLSESYSILDLKTFDVFIRNLNFQRFPNIHSTIEKHFWCGNARYDIHRYLILAYTIRYSGNYSWNAYGKISKDFYPPYTDWIGKKLYIETPQLYNILKNGNDRIIQYKDLLTSTRDEIEFLKSYEGCFCCIVNETKFAQPIANISEKVINPMLMKRPFILVAPPYSLEYLKKLGFKTFDKYWDESYDTDTSHRRRLLKIFKLIDYIGNMPLKQLQNMYNDMSEILLHNRKKVLNLYQNKIIL